MSCPSADYLNACCSQSIMIGHSFVLHQATILCEEGGRLTNTWNFLKLGWKKQLSLLWLCCLAEPTTVTVRWLSGAASWTPTSAYPETQMATGLANLKSHVQFGPCRSKLCGCAPSPVLSGIAASKDAHKGFGKSHLVPKVYFSGGGWQVSV